MVFKFNIPLQQEISIAFQDSFDSKNPVKDARAWVYQILTKHGANWTNVLGNGGFGIKKLNKYGKIESEDVSLKKINLKEWKPKSNPEWLPEKWESEDVQSFEIKIGTALFEKLENFLTVNRYGAIIFNESAIKYEESRDDVKSADAKEHDAEIERNKKDAKKYESQPIEKFLHGILLQPIIDKVKEHEKKLLDKEFEELYGDEDEDKKKKPPEGAGGVRKDPKEKEIVKEEAPKEPETVSTIDEP